MIILGINKNHHSSVCLFNDDQLIYYNQEERLSRIKKDYGIPIECLKEVKKITSKLDVIVFTGYNYNKGEDAVIFCVMRKMGFDVSLDSIWSYYNPHHISHAFKSFYSSEFSESLVIVWDGGGSDFSLNRNNGSYETTSCYYIKDKVNIELLHKNITQDDTYPNCPLDFSNVIHTTDINVVNVSKNLDVGEFYDNVSNLYGFGRDEPGKLMGLHSYGNANQDLQKEIIKDNILQWNFLEKIDPKNFDYAYETQKGIERLGINLIQEMLDKAKTKNVVLTGGVSLNVVANSFYRENLPKDINLYVDPLCSDEATCIGSVQLYFYQRNLDKKTKNATKSLYIGGKISDYRYELKEGEGESSNVNYSLVTDLIIAGNIVAIYQGKSEAGPRALGNRSLLFDPRVINGKEIVNRVKKREPFRPFACSIMSEYLHEWFDTTHIKDSPYMMYSFNALPGVKEKIPSVIHVDNTCRVQTVDSSQNFHYYNLIKNFYQKTSVPLLFNTSFNLAGEPMVETLEDALNTLRNSEINYLYLPEVEKIIHIPC